MGCNIMRTPHIALGVMAILDLLGLDYATVGGGAKVQQAALNGAIESRAPFEVVNWVSLLGRALGVEQTDRYRAFAMLGDEDLILEEALALDAGQGIPIEKLREAIRWEMKG
jgi:hypothetical protein